MQKEPDVQKQDLYGVSVECMLGTEQFKLDSGVPHNNTLNPKPLNPKPRIGGPPKNLLYRDPNTPNFGKLPNIPKPRTLNP